MSGLFIMVAASTIGVVSNSPANAALLNGHIEAIDMDNGSSDTTRGAVPDAADTPQILTTGGAPIADEVAKPSIKVAPTQTQSFGNGQPSLGKAPTVAYGRSPNAGQVVPPPNSFPENYSGRWQCVTRVVDSAVDTVAVGTELVSEVSFVEVPGGRVVARWAQPGWTETQASAMSWSSREAQTDRTSYYFGEGMNGSWASRSRDHFMQTGTDRLDCKSYVDQYMDGRYVGRYRTVSVLTRVGAVNTIAQGERKE
ncbi:hypothetical protein KF707_17900 [Candidatus Obscuribacterales bacterium]|nr:hypothetical protein [Candidatus Obscuribacterales bacterium]